MKSLRGNHYPDRTKEVMDKGEMITHKDVLYLKRYGFNYVEIEKVIGVQRLDRKMRDWKKRVKAQGLNIKGVE